MTSRIFAVMVLMLIGNSSFAQEGGKIKESNAHIGLVYPLSTNWVDAYNYKNRFSIHALAGVSASEEGFCASGVANVVRYNANGFIAGGSVNVILENASGFQAAGFVNYIGKHAKGFQAGGFANVVGSGTGFQAGGFANINRKNFRGVQAGGFMNYAKKVNGFQLGGFANVADKVEGAQVSGAVNVAKDIKGAQIAGYINVAKKVHTQVSGFLNIAGEVKGAQVSGFMNIADSCAWPVGFVNISRKGEKYIGVTVDDNLTTMVAFRSGGKYLYGIVGAGANFSYNNEPLYALEAGIGGHIPLGKSFRINAEISTTTLSDFWTTAQFTSSFRVLPAVKLGKRVELFGGPTFNYESSDTYFPQRRSYNIWENNKWGYYQAMYIGVMGGLHFDI